MTAFADNFFAMLNDLLTDAVGHAVAMDPGSASKISHLNGKSIEIRCSAPPITAHVNVIDSRAQVKLGASPLPPSAIVSGDGLDLISYLTPGSRSGSKVRIEGDEQLLSDLVSIVKGFRPDPAEPLERVLGAEMAATFLGRAELGLRSIASIAEGIGHSLQDQAAGRFVTDNEKDRLLGGIDELRLRVDRLAARVRLAEERHQHK